MGFSTAQLVQLQYNLARGRKQPLEPANAYAGPEKNLHDKIEDDLRRRRWFYEHNRMDMATTGALGETDFTIAAPLGVSAWLEVKRKGKKLTKEQNIARHCLLALGHLWFLIYSMEDYDAAMVIVEARVSAMAVT